MTPLPPRSLPADTPPLVTTKTWWPLLWRRIRRHFLLKFVGVSFFTSVFFALYFHTLRNPVRAVQEMPLTALDHAINVQPHWLWAYVSLWIYVGVVPGLMWRLREVLLYGAWAGGLCLLGLAVFHFYPTAVPRLPLPVDVAQHPGFALLQGVDAAGNACPSLHVATSVFTALWLHSLLQRWLVPAWLRWANVCWALAIVYSTLAIKQHVVLDVVVGALLGSAFAWLSMRSFGPLSSPDEGGDR